MRSRRPIQNKLVISSVLLALTVLVLSISGFYGVYAYRRLAKNLNQMEEARLATAVAERVIDLRFDAARLAAAKASDESRPGRFGSFAEFHEARERFRRRLIDVREAVAWYRDALHNSQDDPRRFGNPRREMKTIDNIVAALDRLEQSNNDVAWVLDEINVEELQQETERLEQLSNRLPHILDGHVSTFIDRVRGRYRTFIVLAWTTAVLTTVLLIALFQVMYVHVLRPLRIVLKGSRKIAQGRFDHQIALKNKGEMSDLADAFNHMTRQFERLRAQRRRQVRERTTQIVGTERMAGVGFLAAGVSHEINNPLASIAISAEALQRRLAGRSIAELSPPERDVFLRYLDMIESEAARCQGITEKLFNFSHVRECRRQRTDLGELVAGTIAVLGHVGDYRRKRVEFFAEGDVSAEVDAQEMKQVMLNLLTNALDSIDADGRVVVELKQTADSAMIVVRDNGRGMTDEVREKLFEPFFTSGKEGQGTGLGLSIADRIVARHGGRIEAHSAGPGTGAEFRVMLPLAGRVVQRRAA